MARTDRGAIRVGSGYVEITPRIARDALRKFRADLKSSVARAGEEAGKGFSKGAASGLASLPKAASAAAKKAKAEIEGAAKAAGQAVLRTEQGLTKQLAKEGEQRLRAERQLAERRGQLHEQVARTAVESLARTARAESRAGEQAVRTQRATVESARAAQRQRVQAARGAEREIRSAAHGTALAMQAARRADLENQIRSQSQISSLLRQQLTDHHRHIQQLENGVNQSVIRVRDSLRKTGSGIDEIGSTASEAGRLITHHLIAPLTVVSSLLTTIGVKAADSFKTLELGLQGMSMKQRDINSLSRNMTRYAVATPYSLEDMQTFSTRFARVFTSHGASSKEAAQKTENIIKAVGDNAAASGILDPNMVQRGLYALTIMGDTDRVNMRNLKQFESATGMPAEEIATMMGYKAGKQHKTAFAAMAAAMQDPKKSGGVSGVEFIDKVIGHWQGSGREGAAAKIGTKTITGRVQSLQEQAKLALSDLFIRRGEGDKPSEYTELGKKLMGDGGVLDQLGRLGSSIAKSGFAEDTLKTFFDVISEFTSWAQDTVDFVRQHPALKDALLVFAKIAAVAAPLLIGMGLLTKVVGKVTKLAGAGARPIGAVARGARGGVRAARQVGSGAAAAARGRSYREAYRSRRSGLRGGDDRGPVRRAADRARGRNSQVEQVQVQTHDADRALRQSAQHVQELRDALQRVNRTSLASLVDQLVGSGGRRSVSSAASSAQREVRSVVTQGTTTLNGAELGRVQSEFRQTGTTAENLKKKIESATREVGQLNDKKLVALRIQFDTAEGTVQDLKDKVQRSASEIAALNRKTLTALRAEVGSLQSSVNKARDAVDKAGVRVASLNRRSLATLRGQVDKVTDAADGAYKKVGQGTGAGSLAGRIGLLNTRSLKTVTGHVQDLGDALKKAEGHASRLDSNLSKVGKQAPGGGSGSGGKKKRTKKARGGVMPGYAPWVDNIPAMLSPGESVLRPEVTAALGADTINSWNQLAVRGQISRYARGGVVERFGLGNLRDLVRERGDLVDIARVTADTMQLDGSSDALGGPVQGGVLRTGDNTAQWAGAASAPRFRALYDWMTADSWQFLRRAPTLVGQVAGIVGGAFAPTLKDYFWDDVWKGEGNIVDRGNRFMADTFSFKTLARVTGDLFGGLWESITSLVGGAKDLTTDPIGSVTDSFGAIWEITADGYNQLVDMVRVGRDMRDSPLEYSDRVTRQWLENAQEAMPNTKGLFDFSGEGKLDSKRPDFDGPLSGGPAPSGGAVSRWKPAVQRALSDLGLSSSYTDLVLHRIQVESGGNPTAINSWDINAKNGVPSQGLMQTIPPTFAAYAGPYRLLGITNPLANIYAGLNYAVHRYGKNWPKALSGSQGYWMGTASASPGLRLVGENGPELVNFQGGERVHTNRHTRDLLSDQGKRYEIHIHEAKSEDSTQAVLRAMQYAEAMYGR